MTYKYGMQPRFVVEISFKWKNAEHQIKVARHHAQRTESGNRITRAANASMPRHGYPRSLRPRRNRWFSCNSVAALCERRDKSGASFQLANALNATFKVATLRRSQSAATSESVLLFLRPTPMPLSLETPKLAAGGQCLRIRRTR